MLKAELRKEIDSRWQSCWPVNTLRPLVLIDCICYLLFLKKLQDLKLIAGSPGHPRNGKVCYIINSDELTWDYIKNLDSKSLHDLFIKENGIADLLKGYGHTNLPYSSFLKAPLLINPSGVLLFNMVKIIEIIESQDTNTRAAIFDYLLHKEEIHTTLGQVYIPADIVNAIISLVKPVKDEIICDPSCGNGDFLVSAASYISQNGFEKKSPDVFQKIIGFDSDPVQLRIAAMNMLLHGIKEPSLSEFDTSDQNHIFPEKPAVIISNLFFASIVQNNNVTDTCPLTAETTRKDIILLKSIVNNLRKGSRAIVIVRNYILSNNLLPEVINLRKQLVDKYKMDAVINLPDKTGAVSSDASILIFHLAENKNNDKVWFYKMKQAPPVFEDAVTNTPEIIESEYIDEDVVVADTKTKSKPRNHKSGKITLSESFCISLEELTNNYYNLAYNQYRRNGVSPQPGIPVKREIPVEITTIQLPPTTNQKFFNAKNKLVAQVFILNKVIGEFVIKSEKLITNKGKLIAKTFVSHKPAPQLVIKIKKFFIDNGSRIRKIFTSNKTASQLLVRTHSFFQERGKLNGNAFALNNTTSQLLLNTQKLFDTKNKHSRKIFSPTKNGKNILISLILLGGILMGFLLIYNPKKPDNAKPATQYISAANINESKSLPAKTANKRKARKALTPQQVNALVNDTSEIIHFENIQATSDASIVDSPTIPVGNNNLKNIRKVKKQLLLSASTAGIEKIRYIVKDTTFFHDRPDESTARKAYLDPLRKAVLTPLKDSNGYIYIVYTNKINIKSKGWINKKALMLIP